MGAESGDQSNGRSTEAEFVVRCVVRFSDCDPAGIVFFPNYYLMLNGVVEDWWAHMGHPWTTTIVQRRLGAPTAQLDASFLAPSKFGDAIDFHLKVESLGNTSLMLVHRVIGSDGRERVRFRQRMVCTSLDTHRPVSWPDDMRRSLEKFMENAHDPQNPSA